MPRADLLVCSAKALDCRTVAKCIAPDPAGTSGINGIHKLDIPDGRTVFA
ncbi:hypothetical protein [Kribbella sp. NPDC049227]